MGLDVVLLAALMPLQMGMGELRLALEQLVSPVRVLYVAAHPDDENTQLLAYLEKERHIRTAYLSLTRGGGGQNLVGAEQGDVLGMMRTQELLGARRVDGAEQFFSRARDFGYSKSAEETLQYWGHETVLRDVVRVVRTFRPHVIITRFPEFGQTHGHHLASARLAHEAFAVAGSEDCFTDQLDALSSWQPSRLFFNGRRWTGDTAPEAARRTFALETGGYNALLGESYGELAARGRSHHASQGFGSAGRRERTVERLFLLEGAGSDNPDPFQGLASEWERSEEARAAKAALDAALADFHTESRLAALVRALVAVRQMNDDAFRQEKEAGLTAIIAAAAGIFADVRAESPRLVPGAEASLEVEFRPRATTAVLESVVVQLGERELARLEGTGAAERTLAVQIPDDAAITVPYWLQQSHVRGAFVVSDRTRVGEPEGPPAIRAAFRLRINDVTLTLHRAVRSVRSDRVRGERAERVVIAPPMSLTGAGSVILLRTGETREVQLQVRSTAAVEGELRLPEAPGYAIEPARIPLRFERADQTVDVSLRIRAEANAVAMTLSPVLHAAGRDYGYHEDRIDHDHISPMTLLRPAQIRLSAVRSAAYEGQVAYLQGAGDRVPESLRQLGVRVAELSFEELRTADLSAYAAVVLGVRAYNTHGALADLQPRLFEYVENGGVLITQYNTNSWFGRLGVASVGPYPLTITRDRVTNERANVVQERDPILLGPNAITEQDFEGWVQERGLYFARDWDERYRTPLSMADPGASATRGSLLVADVGRGRFVYTGLSFFRQLPAGVPGAARLFLNLLTPRTSGQ
ncbi:MAG: PIG-L family deacetylase [Myxococcota bacterium]